MRHASRLIRHCCVPLLLLVTLLVSPYNLAAQPNPAPFTLAQQLFTLDAAQNQPTAVDELVPGLRAILRTTVTNTGANQLFVRIEWPAARYSSTPSPTAELTSEVVRLAAGETRSFNRPVPPPPPTPPTFRPEIDDEVLISVVTACVPAGPAAADQPCPNPDANPATSVRNVLSVPVRGHDLGDAPDSTNHAGAPMLAYPGVQANFPTVYDPTTGTPSGPLHADPRPFHLGKRVSLEAEADIGPDQDPRNNIEPAANRPNNDRGDDGIRIDPATLSHCRPATVTAEIFIAPGFQAAALAAGVNRGYLNIWIDGTRDGDWADAVQCPAGSPAPRAVEHVLIDAPIDLASLSPGMNTLSFTTGPVVWSDADKERAAWMRATLSIEPSAKPLPAGDLRYGDGRGREDAQGNPQRFRYGETEDYLINRRGAAAQPDLEVRKVGRVAFDEATGQRIAVWLVEYRNTGGGTATNVVLTEAIEANNINTLLLGVQSDPDVAATPDGSTLRFAIGSVAPDEGGRILLRTRIPADSNPAGLVNTVTISAAADANPANNSASATLRAGVQAPVITEPGSGITNNTSVTFQGLAAPGAQVRVFDEDGPLDGDDVAEADGRWSITTTLDAGRNRIVAQARLNGQNSPRSTPLNLLVNPNLPFDPLSMLFDAGTPGTRYRPDDANGRTGLTGWVAHLRPNTAYSFSVRANCAQPGAAYTLQVGGAAPQALTNNGGVYSGSFNSGSLSTPLPIVLNGTCGAQTATASGLGTAIETSQVVDALTGAPIAGAALIVRELTVDDGEQAPIVAGSVAPITTDGSGLATLNPQLRALQVQVTAEGYQPFTVRSAKGLGNFEIQDLLSLSVPNAQVNGGSLIDSTGVFTHWREPLTATFRLLPLLTNESRIKRILGPSGFNESSISLQPGTVIDFVNTDFRARSILSPRDPASGLPTGNATGPTLLHDGHDHDDHNTEAPLDSGLIAPGASVAIRFDKPGVYTVVDGENGYSTLTVIVSANAPPPDGVYRVYLPTLRR
jgi:hypothetical protein